MALTQAWIILLLLKLPAPLDYVIAFVGVTLIPAINLGLFLGGNRGGVGFVYGLCLAPMGAGLCGLFSVAFPLDPWIFRLAPALLTMPLAGVAAAPFGSKPKEEEPGLAAAIAVGALLALITAVLLLSSARLRLSWHGLLHTSIAYRIMEMGVPPENPFFAGKPLIYYWYYHLAAAGMSKAANLSPLIAFAVLNIIAVGAVVPCLYLSGRAAALSSGASLLGAVIGALALNPLGPLFFVLQEPGITFQDLAGGDNPGRLIGYMGLGFDLRLASPLTKFWNVSSFATAVPLFIMGLHGSLRMEKPGWRSFLVIFFASLSLLAINPLVGLCFMAPVGLSAFSRFRNGKRTDFFTMLAALAAGGAAGLPYLLSITSASGEGSFFRLGFSVESLLGVLLAAGPVLIFAALGTVGKASPRSHLKFNQTGEGLQLILFCLGLSIMALFFKFSEGNEYKIIRLLIYPAGILAGIPAALLLKRQRPQKILMAALLCAALLPNSVIAFAAYVSAGGAEVPLEDEALQLRLTSSAGGLKEAYRILLMETPPDAMVVVNPEDHKHSLGGFKQGDEVPALTRRVLYTGHEFYLTDSYPEFPNRLERVTALFNEKGGALPEPLDGRPLYVLVRSDTIPEELEADTFEEVYRGSRCALFRHVGGAHSEPE